MVHAAGSSVPLSWSFLEARLHVRHLKVAIVGNGDSCDRGNQHELFGLERLTPLWDTGEAVGALGFKWLLTMFKIRGRNAVTLER